MVSSLGVQEVKRLAVYATHTPQYYPVFKREFKIVLTISVEICGKYQTGIPFITDISPCSPPSAEPYH